MGASSLPRATRYPCICVYHQVSWSFVRSAYLTMVFQFPFACRLAAFTLFTPLGVCIILDIVAYGEFFPRQSYPFFAWERVAVGLRSAIDWLRIPSAEMLTNATSSVFSRIYSHRSNTPFDSYPTPCPTFTSNPHISNSR